MVNISYRQFRHGCTERVRLDALIEIHGRAELIRLNGSILKRLIETYLLNI